MKMLKSLLLAAVMTMTAMFMTGCGYDSKQGFTTDSPEEVAKKFLKATENCDFDDIKKYSSGTVLSEIVESETKYRKASSEERKVIKELAKLFGVFTVKSSDKTDSFWADGEKTCEVKLQAFGEDSGKIKLKRKDIFSPWYVVDCEID